MAIIMYSPLLVILLTVLCYCCFALPNAWSSSEEESHYRYLSKNVTMEELCPGWGRPPNWHIPPRTPRPGCCQYTENIGKYYQTLCFKYGWKPPKGWVHPGPVTHQPATWRGPHAHMYDDYYYGD